MKRILLYTTQMLPTGGIESHVLEFCEKMEAPDVRIDMIVGSFHMWPAEEARLRKYCHTVWFMRMKSALLRQVLLIGVGLRLLFSKKYDVLYTNGAGLSIRLLSRIIKHRLWVHHHHMSADPATLTDYGVNYVNTMATADVLVACSDTNARLLALAVNRPVDVVYCFSRDLGNMATAPAHGDGKIHFGYYGRLVKEKGIDLICRLGADPLCSGISFDLWGEGENYPPSFFEAYPQVHYHTPFTDLEGLKKAVGSLDALLLLSTHAEGLPISLLEAMSAGLPWLATPRGGIPDVALDPMATRIIPDLDDYEAVRTHILEFAADIASGKVSRESQKALYRLKFSAGVLVNRWRELFNIDK